MLCNNSNNNNNNYNNNNNNNKVLFVKKLLYLYWTCCVLLTIIVGFPRSIASLFFNDNRQTCLRDGKTLKVVLCTKFSPLCDKKVIAIALRQLIVLRPMGLRMQINNNTSWEAHGQLVGKMIFSSEWYVRAKFQKKSRRALRLPD